MDPRVQVGGGRKLTRTGFGLVAAGNAAQRIASTPAIRPATTGSERSSNPATEATLAWTADLDFDDMGGNGGGAVAERVLGGILLGGQGLARIATAGPDELDEPVGADAEVLPGIDSRVRRRTCVQFFSGLVLVRPYRCSC